MLEDCSKTKDVLSVSVYSSSTFIFIRVQENLQTRILNLLNFWSALVLNFMECILSLPSRLGHVQIPLVLKMKIGYLESSLTL
jgi:hypothetical protein